MFYSIQILSRKGALGTIWVASHLEKRLKRNQIFETSIPASVDSIINPEAPLALRLSGQLLLGVVRVYLRKLAYLQQDAEHAVEGLARGAGGAHTAGVDLPDGGTAPEGAITLPPGSADPLALFAAAGGGDLFPTFESDLLSDGLGAGRGGALFSGAADSLTVAEDISELFGSKWSAEDERFDVPDQIDRRFSIELERLRSAAAAEAAKPGQGLFFEPPPGEDAYALPPEAADEQLAPPSEDLFAPAPPGSALRATPASAGAPLPGIADMRVTPPSLGGPDLLLPDLGPGPATTVTSGGTAGAGMPSLLSPDAGAAAGEAPLPPPSAARRARPPRQRAPRRRPPTLDVDPKTRRPVTELPRDEIRALLLDRKPLLVPRGLRARPEPPAPPPRRYDVPAGAAGAPASFSSLAPELLALFRRAAGAEPAGTPGATQRRRGGADVEEEAEDGGAAAGSAAEAAVEEAMEGGEGPLPSALTSGISDGDGAFSSLPSVRDGLEVDYIEDSQREAAAAAGRELFTAGPEGGEDGAAGPLSPGGSARRASLLLEPASTGTPHLSVVDDEGSEGSGLLPAARDGFTQRTRLVLDHLRDRFAPPAGSKRRHGGTAVPELSLGELAEGRTRLEACRWFFEALVLRGKGYVDLRQDEPYSDIAILPRERLFAVGPGSAAPSTGRAATASTQ